MGTSVPFCHLWARVQPIDKIMDIVWQEIIHAGLLELIDKTGAPAPGAKLRGVVARIALERGLDFPPAGVRKFTDLVEAFPADFILQRRPGSDVMVVPAARAELLAVEPSAATFATARIRQDLFEALTRVPLPSYGVPYYDPDDDAVTYVKDGEQPPKNGVPLPATSLDNELALRRSFRDEPDLGDPAKDALTAALTTNTPLRDFSHAVQQFGLVKKWHSFRLALIATKLRKWSVRTGLPWQQSWIDTVEPRQAALSPPAAPVSLDSKRHLLELSALLTEEDLARISVPMDIVLRLLSKK